MSRRTLSCSLLAVLLLFLAGAEAGMAAPPPTNPGQDRLDQMRAEGWNPVANGVLKRNAGKMVETFAMGPEGFSFVYQELRSHLGFLIGEYRRYPSGKLAQTIRSVQAEMTRIESDVQTLQSLTSQPAAGCNFSFGASAHAYPTSTPRGVKADASAYFNNNCGYVGETYAYAYARAKLNNTTTTVTQTDPDTGANVSSSATAAAAGSQDCYSYAYARASSTDLGINYSVAQDNYECPAPPPTVTIGGPTNVFILGYTCKVVTWTSTVSGGTPPYSSYAWYRNGYLVGSGTSYSETFCGDNWTWTETANVSLTVTDSAGQPGSDTHTTYVNYSGYGGCLMPFADERLLPEEEIPCVY